MFSPLTRIPGARLVVTGACAGALLLGPVAGMASADDTSLAKTIAERSQQLGKREKAVATKLKSLQKSPSLSRAKSAQKDAAAIYRTTEAFRDEVRDDDGSSEKGQALRDEMVPALTAMATAAKKLDRQLVSATKKRTVTKAAVTKAVSAKLTLDKAIQKVFVAIEEAFSDDPDAPAPPKDPTA